MTGPGTHALQVPADAAAQRVDRYVADVTGLSRSHVQKLISAGNLTADGLLLKANTVIGPGTALRLVVPEPEALDMEPAPEIPVAIVYQDADLLIVNKPAGLVVHPSPGHGSGTLVNALLALDPDAGGAFGGIAGVQRPGIVHRLDRDTSGLLVVARSAEAHRRLQSLLRRRDLKREYLALVAGRPRSRAGRIEAPIGRDRTNPLRHSLDTANPRDAVTHFEVEELFPRHALIRASLETGRTHQIRVHLAAIDLPIAGDPTYGRPAELGLERQFLHAARLAFPHPITDEPVDVASPLPTDLAAALNEARAARGSR